ncbi:hypothetical protein VTK73DRAFT_10324 [Phialemonium thermophilum]|uniref:Uncharacterized protein n=1 Tax=Phialemonium thermophilum TaxID=223376 RepID=A0ABR3XGQ5_9PEZI
MAVALSPSPANRIGDRHGNAKPAGKRLMLVQITGQPEQKEKETKKRKWAETTLLYRAGIFLLFARFQFHRSSDRRQGVRAPLLPPPWSPFSPYPILSDGSFYFVQGSRQNPLPLLPPLSFSLRHGGCPFFLLSAAHAGLQQTLTRSTQKQEEPSGRRKKKSGRGRGRRTRFRPDPSQPKPAKCGERGEIRRWGNFLGSIFPRFFYFFALCAKSTRVCKVPVLPTSTTHHGPLTSPHTSLHPPSRRHASRKPVNSCDAASGRRPVTRLRP